MTIYNNNRTTNYYFSFQDLVLNAFLKTTGSWVYHSADRLSGKLDRYRDIIESPDRNDPLKSSFEDYIESKYYTIKKSGRLFNDAAKQSGFSVLHCNTRSLGKTISLLHDILQTIKSLPDIIAISETKINENTCANLNIPGYVFINTNSTTQAGGVGLYLSTELEFTRRHDLDTSYDGIESRWVEL